jgi:hypothetical protein
MSGKILQGCYCGPIEILAGRRALVRTNAPDCRPGHLMAQFNEPVIVNDARGYIAGGTPLNVGWHRFPVADFDLDVEYD